jgi:hypothetical protein
MKLTKPQDATFRIPPRPTLAHVPGVTVTADRRETDPTLPVIRSDKPARRPHGIALQAAALQRAQWVREALQEVRE